MSQARPVPDPQVPVWLPQLTTNGGPRFLQIADALQAAIVAGSLAPGDRLPPQRHLAVQLDIDLTTVTRAYDEARRRNLLEGRGARGTYVAAPKVGFAAVIDLSMNTPPPPAGVDVDDMLKQGLSQVLLSADNQLLMAYHLGGGSDADRQAGATWLEPMCGRLDPAHIVVCPGAQAAIAAAILAHTAPGDTVLAEPMGYPGLRDAVTHLGRRLVAVEADEHGMVPERLEQACRRDKPGLIYLNPTLQNPTAITMPRTPAPGACRHRAALRRAHSRGRSLLAAGGRPAAADRDTCPRPRAVRLDLVEMPGPRFACRVRGPARPGPARPLPCGAAIIRLAGHATVGRAGHPVDRRRVGRQIDAGHTRRSAPAPADGARCPGRAVQRPW